jgi:hypothetical protein
MILHNSSKEMQKMNILKAMQVGGNEESPAAM